MNRTIWPLSAVLIAVILAVGGILAARSLRPARLIIDKGPDGVVEGLQMPPGLAVLGQHPKCCVSRHGREVTGRSALEPGTTRPRGGRPARTGGFARATALPECSDRCPADRAGLHDYS